MNILALFAHPDDVEIECGGTLLKYRQAGHRIYIALTTSGNTGSNVLSCREEIASTREKEQLAAAKYLDAEVMFLRYEDEGLFDTPETRRAVLTAIRWAKPDVIFTHDPKDYSPDHNITAKLVTQAMLCLSGQLYDADLPPIEKMPMVFFKGKKCFVDISSELDTKLEMINCHQSQYAWLATFHPEAAFTERVKVCDRMRGMWAGCGYAEGYEAFRMPGFCTDYRVLP